MIHRFLPRWNTPLSLALGRSRGLLIVILLTGIACRLSSAAPPSPPANFCGPGTEIERTVISGAQMGQGTTVAFAVPESRTPTAIAVLDQSSALVACAYIDRPVPTEGAFEVPLEPVSEPALSGAAQLSPGEGRYEGRLAIKITTRGNDPFSPYWLVLVGE